MSNYRKFDDYLKEAYHRSPELKESVKEAEAFLDIALTLRQLRTKRGLTQGQLANMVGTSQANIARWETPGYTEYTLASLMKLASALEANVNVKLASNYISTSIKEDAILNLKRKFAVKVTQDQFTEEQITREAPVTLPESSWSLQGA